MTSSPTRRFGSAHALALTALCVSLAGGGYAIGATRTPRQPGLTSAYSVASTNQVTEPQGNDRLITQLVVPNRGYYVVDAKLNISKASGQGWADGAVSCYLNDVPGTPNDINAVSINQNDTATLSLQSIGGHATGRKGSQAFDLVCSSYNSKYVVSDVRVTAVKVDAIHRQ